MKTKLTRLLSILATCLLLGSHARAQQTIAPAEIIQPAQCHNNCNMWICLSHTNIYCGNTATGTAHVTAYGGYPPYSYVWHGPNNFIAYTASISNLAAGTYSVTVSSYQSSCSESGTVCITSTPALNVTVSSPVLPCGTNIACFGGTGSATAAVTGGTPPYTYSWSTSPVQTTATATGLTAGSYTVTVHDAHNCVSTASVILYAPPAVVATMTSVVNNMCYGGTTGSATVVASGGSSPYTYSWSTSPAQHTAHISNLAAGTYSVTVTDHNQCSATASVTITQPPAINVSISSQNNINCYGGSGSATASASGGTPPYSYSWNTTPVQTTATATNLSAGPHTVTVTDSHGCPAATASVTITGPSSALAATISAHTNVSCYGNTNGSATVSASGGTSPYTYSWNTIPVQTSATASNLGAGNYIVTVTDAHNCSTTASVSITQPSSGLTAAICGHDNISCFGGSNGTAMLMASGGTAPYTYSWNTIPVQTTVTAINLSAGTYIGTITDANGCSASASITLTQPASSLSATISSHTDVSCFGNTNGSATVSVSGGTAPYIYSWNTSPVQTSATASNLGAGTYIVTIADANGCSATASVIITQPASALTAGVCTHIDVTCFGGSNGSAMVMISGGTAPYTYSWSTTPVQTTATANNLSAGTYSVVITDANGCSVTQTVTITQPASALSATISAQTNVSCFGGNQGSATVSASGGTAPYTYSWNTTPVQASATASNLVAGNYMVTITDANGCSATASVIITQPASALSASISTQTNVSCYGNTDGSATVSVSGGTAPYSYSWNTLPVQTSATASNLGAGTYIVTIADANGCSATASVIITQPASALSASISAQTNVSCYGNTNGSATVSVSGGTAPYSYSWNTLPIQTSATASGLGAGTYIVTVIDTNGCSATASVIITQPASALTGGICAHVDVTCFGGSNGSLMVMASGGTAPYTYSWSTTPVQTTATASGLSAGTYTVTVTDANGCTVTSTATITQPASALSASISAQTNVSCFGNNDGSATVMASGGTGPYSYSWSTVPVQTSATASNLAAGNYAVTVTDANGCTATASVSIFEPAAALTATISSSFNVSCFGGNNGSATVMAAGGTAPYTYNWNTSPVQTSATASNLVAGTYIVTVTDSNGCSATASVTISQPASALSASISAQTNVSCYGNMNGSATVSASGGTAPYSYNWNTTPVQTSATANNLGAGVYMVTVTDAHGCTATASVEITQPATALTGGICGHVDVTCFGGNNGSLLAMANGGTAPYTYLWAPGGQTTALISNLSAGTYTVVVTDANGCTVTSTATITQPASALSASISAQTNISCFGGNNGSATVSVSGGTAPYDYNWNTIPIQTSATANNLVAGSYTVTITDANGCSATASVTISQPASALSASISAQTNVSCYGNTNGSATVSVSGGTASYDYSWNTLPIQTSATASNLAAGTYTVTVTDANGCSATASVIITQPATALTGGICGHVDVTCFGGSNGSLLAMANGGTAPYTYLWAPGGDTAALVSNLPAGNYSVTVTDANGCTVTSTTTITQPASAIAVSVSAQTNVSCFGGNGGSVTVNVTGGTAPYSYSWNTIPVQTSATISNLSAGVYIVTVTDANGCTANGTITISQPASALSASISAQTNVACFGGNHGSATVSANGGTSPYTYSWNTSPAQTSATASNLVAGNYMVTVTDSNGCSATASVTISQPASALSASISAQTNVSCYGNMNGSATVSASGGTAPYSYNWNTTPVQTSATASNLIAGSYIVTVTDSNGCSVIASVTISQPASALSAIISAHTDVSCYGNNNGSAVVTVIGGTAPYTYSWNTSPVQTSVTASNLVAGNYIVTVTDSNGCSATASVTIAQPQAALFASISAQHDVSCFGGNGGYATVSASGGTAPYSYSWNTSPVQTSATASNLVAGNYMVTVTDSNGCSATASVTISQPAAALSASISAQTNVSCFGNNNGSATVSVSGGTAPYFYNWNTSPVQTSATASNLSAGSYMVTVTDSNGCSVNASVIITQPASALSAIISAHTDVSCYGNNNGSAVVTVIGGTAPYTYSWNTSPVQTSATASNLVAGNYIVTVTDSNGCSATASVTIAQPQAALFASISAQHDVSCFGGNGGSATVSASGGTAPYSYSWNTSPVQTSATANNLVAGNYIVTVTDSNGCSATASVTISQPAAALSASISAQTNVSCFGNNNGSATVSVSGGTAPYFYNWNTSPVQTSATASNLSAGSYMVTVTDSNGCSVIASVNISQPASALSASVSAQTNISCYGDSSGSATILVSGGTAPYTYSWNTNPAQLTATANNLAAGSYLVYVIDANNCSVSLSVTITQPSVPLAASISAQTNVSCFGNNNGSATVSVSGGAAPYSYSWNTSPVQNTATASGLAAGNYMVTVTDANNCSTTASVNITQPASALAIGVAIQADVLCFGDNTGSANVIVSGGTAPYSYSWSTSPVQTSATAVNLAAGTYTVTVSDSNNCSASAIVTINGPAAALSASISSHTDIGCDGNPDGSATVAVSGGTGPYSYSWNTVPAQTGATASGLAAGNYTVTVTDQHGCTATASVTISQPSSPISLNASVSNYNGSNISCNGGNNGYINITITGGTAPYAFDWSGPNFSSSSQNISGLGAGSYELTVTDSAGCSATMVVNMTEPAETIAIVSSVTNVSCSGGNNGSIDLTVSGGTAPYTFAWTGPGSFSATTKDIAGLIAGMYSVIVTDANGCSAGATINIAQPDPIIVSFQESVYNGSNISCHGGNDGSINMTVNGGSPSYSFTWTGPNGFNSGSEDISGLYAGNYNVTVTDQNGCMVTMQDSLSEPLQITTLFTSMDANCTMHDGLIAMDVTGGTGNYSYLWSNGSTSHDLSGLTAGAYTVSIVDGNGCSLLDTAYVGSASYLEAQSVVSGPDCSGSNEGSIVMTITNGTAPFTYAWSNGGTTNSLSGLAPGTYICTMSDSMGCVLVDSVEVTAPAQLSLGITSHVYSSGHNISTMNGHDGIIDLTVTGGTAPYTFQWSTGATTEDVSGLAAGTYVVTVTDAMGCSSQAVITLTQPIDLAMPNGFSPNGDGSNDYFVVQGIENYPNNHIEIYNRWGNKVFTADNYTNKWQGVNDNGDPLPDATYFVILEVNGGEMKLDSYVDLRR